MIIIRAGAGGPNFFFEKVSQYRKLCRKHPIPYLNTCITYLNTWTRLSAPYLNTCITYLNTLSRLSAPCITYLYTLSRLHTLIYCRLGNQSESSFTSHPRLSAANQNRVLRHLSRQPIRIEYYVTRVVITSPESSRLESVRYSLS